MRFVDIRAVRRACSLRELLLRWGWMPSRREPATWRGPCPIHGSRSIHSRSLSVGLNGWTCWVCHEFGDVLDMYRWLYGQQLTPMNVAAAQLCALMGVQTPWVDRPRLRRAGNKEEARYEAN
jgi:hypothetical protein